MKTDFQHEIPFDYNETIPSKGYRKSASIVSINKKKWTLMFAPDCETIADEYINDGLTLDSILSFPRKYCCKALLALEKALANDNCSALILGDGVFSNEEYLLLEQKALASKVKVFKIAKRNLH